MNTNATTLSLKPTISGTGARTFLSAPGSERPPGSDSSKPLPRTDVAADRNVRAPFVTARPNYAVSPNGIRLTARLPEAGLDWRHGGQVENLRYSRLEICGTSLAQRPAQGFLGISIGRQIIITIALLLFALGLPTPSIGSDVDGRVVGGHDVNITQHPYQVALLRWPLYDPADLFWSQFCGGSIIDQQWIATAAHCSQNVSPDQVAVAVGVTDLNHPESGRIFRVDRIVIHPDFNRTTLANDVALWHLTEPIQFASTYAARPIGLVTPADAAAGLTAPGRLATITGWGNTSGSGPSYPNSLQAATVPLTTESTYPSSMVTADMIMAGYPAGGVDTCYGDSGGPLVVTNASGTLLLAGITSWGFGCAQAGHPGVYARISFQYGWIRDQLRDAVYVDWRYTGPSPDGSPSRPYPTIRQGFAAARDGNVIRVWTGDYGINLALQGKAVRIEPESGPVILRQAPPAPTPILVANAGLDQDILTDTVVTLIGTARVENTGPVTSWRWEKISGLGRVFSKSDTEATFQFYVSASGPYEFRLTASNGSLTSSDTVRVMFQQPVITVDAGRNQEVPFPWTSSLAGSVLVDEQPNPLATYRWRKTSGPGAERFSAQTSLATGMTVSEKGV